MRLSFRIKITGVATLAVCQPMCARHTGVACLAIFIYFQLLLTVGVKNCSSPSVSLSPSIAKTLLSLFATVISSSRRLLRNAVSLQMWNGSYAIDMPSVLFFHACFLATCAMHLVPPLSGKGRWCCELLLAPDRALIQVSEL